tara:strand:- start:526 stop:852 length:327 start_codon:yes stop_codon:yes gene_type:complete
MSDNNKSLNYLIGNFVSELGGADALTNAVEAGDETIQSNRMISIDTSNGFLGFNTVDPSFNIDVSNNGTIRTGNLILYNIPHILEGSTTDQLQSFTVYREGGFLKIKI